jgi:exodeoxyribonuclease VII small subunit
MAEVEAKETPLTMEQHFQELETLLERLEDKDISLEESFGLYQEGMDHLKACNALIDQVEKKVKLLNDAGQQQDFDEVF